MAGAPACPYLPGPQLLPQQAPWPGSEKNTKSEGRHAMRQPKLQLPFTKRSPHGAAQAAPKMVGAPTCPYPPGPQLLPQQAPWPGSNTKKRRKECERDMEPKNSECNNGRGPRLLRTARTPAPARAGALARLLKMNSATKKMHDGKPMRRSAGGGARTCVYPNRAWCRARNRFCDGAVQGVRMTKPSYNEDSDLIFLE